MKLGELLAQAGLPCPAGQEALEITGVEYDSRRVKKGNLFVCIRGLQADGHIFALDAAFRGAAAVVAQGDMALADLPVIRCGDTRAELPRLAAAFYGHPARDITLLGVTGTNGKTSVTYMLRSILKSSGRNCGIIGTIAYGYGDRRMEAPRTTPESCDLQRMFSEMKAQGIRCCTMEVSSHALAMGRVDGLRFDFSIFTNLTQDHLDFHKNFEEYYQAKKKLFLRTDKACVVNVDDRHGRRLYRELTLRKNGGIAAPESGGGPDGLDDSAAPSSCDVLSYSFADREADYFGTVAAASESGSRFLVKHRGEELGELSVRTPGMFTMYNALGAAACCLAAGVEFSEVRRGLEELVGVPGRFELVENSRGVTAIVDYAHTPDALEMALRTAADFKKGRLICVFGCGGDRDRTKRPVMGRVAGEFADYVIVTSDNPRSEDQEQIALEIEEGLYQTGCVYEMIPNRREAIRRAVSIRREGDVILVAGKGHENYQIIGAAKNYFSDRETVKQLIEE